MDSLEKKHDGNKDHIAELAAAYSFEDVDEDMLPSLVRERFQSLVNMGEKVLYWKIAHADGTSTYIAGQDAKEGEYEYADFADTMDNTVVGGASLHFDHLGLPFTTGTFTEPSYGRGRGLGSRRAAIMNAYCVKHYSMPLYSSLGLSMDGHSMWAGLVRDGLAEHVVDDQGNERYRFKV